MHGDRKIALECEEGDAAYTEPTCAMEEMKFYKDNVDLADMTPSEADHRDLHSFPTRRSSDLCTLTNALVP